jgi:hypothetical protein
MFYWLHSVFVCLFCDIYCRDRSSNVAVFIQFAVAPRNVKSLCPFHQHVSGCLLRLRTCDRKLQSFLQPELPDNFGMVLSFCIILPDPSHMALASNPLFPGQGLAECRWRDPRKTWNKYYTIFKTPRKIPNVPRNVVGIFVQSLASLAYTKYLFAFFF